MSKDYTNVTLRHNSENKGISEQRHFGGGEFTLLAPSFTDGGAA